MHSLIAPLTIAAFVYWLVVALSSLRTIREVPLLRRLAPPTPQRWPKVSVIVPACNEEETIEAAMRTRLGEAYPNAEYIIVDDRSTDGTGAIVDRLAASDARVKALHVEDLPEGWLGKLNAMNAGLRQATGDWILFSDADVHHEPGALARIVAHAEARGVDHVTVLPTFWSGTFWLDAMISAFLRLAVSGSRPWKITDPQSKVSTGAGLFALVRRDALLRAGGLEPLRLEVVDDAALGQLLKWSGARQLLLNARGYVGLSWYRTLSEAIRGLEKNMFAVMRFSVLRFAVGATIFALLETGAFVALAAGHGWEPMLGGITLGLALCTQAVVARWLDRRILPSLFGQVGMVILFGTMIRSMAYTLARGGIVWRGTRYPLDALRRGMRFELT
jgi:glycosyltransferase involved in cell wall biosynthesis